MTVRPPIAIVTSNASFGGARAEEMERLGQPVTLVCLDRSPHVHENATADVVHVPRFSVGVAAAFVSSLLRRPASALLSARIPFAVHVAQLLSRRGITRVEAADEHVVGVVAVVSRSLDRTPADLSELPVDWSRIGSGDAGVRWITKRINSIVAEVSIDGRRVVVKRQRSHAGGSATDRFIHEREAMRALEAASLRVPRILLEDEAHALLVMERAPGTAVDALFGSSHVLKLREAVRGAGRWLAAMQAATRREADRPALLSRLVEKAAEDAKQLAMPRHVILRIEELRNRVAVRAPVIVGHHDDYWPGNVFFDGKKTTVIDFESFRDGFELEDVAYFLFRCELLQKRFRVSFPDLERCFFDGYGRQPDRDALRLFTMTKALRSLANGMGLDLPLPQRVWTRRTITSAVLRAAEEDRGPSFALSGRGER